MRATAERKRQLAWNARILGASWKEAAEIAGYRDPNAAMKAVRRWRGHMPQPELEEHRELARQRGERLWREAWKDVIDHKPGAVTAAVRVLHRQASLLGLDAPTKQEIVAYDGTDTFWSAIYATDPGPTFATDVIEGEVVDPPALTSGDAT